MDYLLRTIPPSLWIRAKRKAAKEDLSLRQVILKLLRAYVNG